MYRLQINFQPVILQSVFGVLAESRILLQAVFYTVAFFGGFAIVETIQRADEIAGDAANPFKRAMAEVGVNVGIFSIEFNVNGYRFDSILFDCPINVSLFFVLGQGSVGNDYFRHISHLLVK